MKKIAYLFLAALICISCEDFLDAESYTKKNAENFPVNETDANQLLTGVYNSLSKAIEDPQHTYFYMAELASDDRFGGGGENDKDMQVLDHLLYTNLDRFQKFWSARYTGINRANMAVTALETMDEGELKNQKLGEALFLRAFSYFELVQMFGDIPFIEAAPETVEDAQVAPVQTDQETIYKYIASDLKSAYEMMPAKEWNEYVSGTVTKWAAAGLLARVYLFYTGFYEKSSLPTSDGEDITTAYVVAALENCMNNSGHDLVPDFRSLWPYTNTASKRDYVTRLNNQGLSFMDDAQDWVRDGNNEEHVFVVKCSMMGSWQTTIGYSNGYALHFAPRNNSDADQYRDIFPVGQGWAAGPVNPRLWREWGNDPDYAGDKRRYGSILSPEEFNWNTYTKGGLEHLEETGYWQKKIVATTAYKDGYNSELWNSFCSTKDYYDDEDDNFQLAHATDLILIRYADILLMHSELTKTADGMNEVRRRVGLSPISYTEENLRKERRYELAFEGLRWGDIRRWHIAEEALVSQLGETIYNRGEATSMKDQGAGYVERYRATKGFMPIPSSEIDLSNGALKQNAGWDQSANYTNWMD